MKANIYSTTREVVDKQGLKHVITVVGALTRERKKIDHISDAYIELGKKSVLKGTLNFKEKRLSKSLVMAMSICHPHDIFDKEIGIKLATSRLKKNNIGKVETASLSMLDSNMVSAMIESKAEYIADNLDKFLPKD